MTNRYTYDFDNMTCEIGGVTYGLKIFGDHMRRSKYPGLGPIYGPPSVELLGIYIDYMLEQELLGDDNDCS